MKQPFIREMVRDSVAGLVNHPGGGWAAGLIASLFAAGQQGFWLPFTDFASLSQDSAGTLPYTALEQPVGRVLDRSGRGNHATQPTSTARGVVSARVNLLLNSNLTGFTTGSPGVKPTDWVLAFAQGSTSSEGGAINLNGEGGRHFVIQNIPNGQLSVEYVFRVSISLVSGAITMGNLVGTNAAAPSSQSWYLDGSLVTDSTPVSVGTHTIEWRSLYTSIPTAYRFCIGAGVAVGSNASVTIYSASVSLASQSSLPYQRVTTPTDYDAVGFPKYARLDGTDDFYTCGGGGSTTGFFFADVMRPMGGAGTRRVIWSDRSGNNGYELAINTSDKLELSAGNGTTITAVASTVSAALAEGKQYEVFDNGTVLSVQIDGSAPVTVARPVVTAGSSTITLYRGASTGYFNGQITEPIYRAGPPPSAYERSVIRAYQMQKAGL